MEDEVKEENVTVKTENTEQPCQDNPTVSKRALKKLKKRQEWLDTRKGNA